MQALEKKILLFTSLLLLLLSIKCAAKVIVGLDKVNEHQEIFANKKIGIITNHTAVNADGKHITEVFSEMDNVKISVLFGPEHGIRGQADAGAKIKDSRDPLTGIPVYSLYGSIRKPTPEMLNKVDLLVFDIQDIGARFYTYIWTMALAMEAAAENNIPFIVLDRPNPINGVTLEGTVLDTAFATFVGMYPIPVRHGMTAGELALLFNEQGWLKNSVTANLIIIKAENWQREQWFDQTGLEFIKPSPNMPSLNTATVYPGLCLLEGTNVSEGRGTQIPFEMCGAPWIVREELAKALNAIDLPGVVFKSTDFKPVSMPGVSTHPKYENTQCNGVQIVVKDRVAFKSYLTGIQIVNTIYNLYPDSFEFRESHFDRLCGTDEIRKSILKTDTKKIEYFYDKGLIPFIKIRQKYLLY